MNHNYFVYIITNPKKSVLYTGVTNDLSNRLHEHFANKGNKSTFAGRYFCFNLLYFEQFDQIEHAIAREKEIKGWTREKKEALIKSMNPDWRFLNSEVMDL
jgi:putative endonuclease